MTRQIGASLAFLVALLALSLLADRGGADQGSVTGTVTAWTAGESIAVASDQTDPTGLQLALRDTVYEGDPRAIKPGVRVTVWYRGVGERLLIADKVRVLVDSTGR